MPNAIASTSSLDTITDRFARGLALRARARTRGPTSSAAPRVDDSNQRVLSDLVQRSRALRSDLGRLGKVGLVERRGGQRWASTLGNASLDLALVPTPATRRSSAEVNATPTSYSPFGPSFQGSSTSLPTIAGTYDGSNGDNVLTFRVVVGGIIGVGGILRLDVFNQANTRLTTLNFGGRPANTPVALPNGLTLSLSSGTILGSDTFQVTVSSTTGASVDPTKPFNGTRNNRPGFETGVTVNAGSFVVNGVSIAVAANDSIDSVLAKMSASSAGVTASFDAGAEKILLTQKTAGSTPTIAFGSDTSGFLAATKLTGSTVQPGTDDESTIPVASVPSLAAIRDGTLAVNGVAVAVDRDVDSLNTIVARIGAVVDDTAATFSSTIQRVSIRATRPGTDLVLDDGSSGFFSAVGITPRTLRAGRNPSRTQLQDSDGVRLELAALTERVNGLVGDAVRSDTGTLRKALPTRIRDAAARAFALDGSAPATTRHAFGGIALDFTRADGRILSFDHDLFERTHREDPANLIRTLVPDTNATGTTGLAAGLGTILDEIERQALAALARRAADRGAMVDTRA